MATKLNTPIRLLLLLIPLIFIVGSHISSCSNSELTNCTNTVQVADQATCTQFATNYQCDTPSFDGTNCTVTNCQVCTCNGDVTAITDQTTCITYANDNQCLTANVENGVCVVEGCLNCEIIVDDSDFVIDDVDDSGFFI